MDRVLKALTREQFDCYRADGGVAQVKALNEEEAARYRAASKSKP